MQEEGVHGVTGLGTGGQGQAPCGSSSSSPFHPLHLTHADQSSGAYLRKQISQRQVTATESTGAYLTLGFHEVWAFLSMLRVKVELNF